MAFVGGVLADEVRRLLLHAIDWIADTLMPLGEESFGEIMQEETPPTRHTPFQQVDENVDRSDAQEAADLAESQTPGLPGQQRIEEPGALGEKAAKKPPVKDEVTKPRTTETEMAGTDKAYPTTKDQTSIDQYTQKPATGPKEQPPPKVKRDESLVYSHQSTATEKHKSAQARSGAPSIKSDTPEVELGQKSPELIEPEKNPSMQTPKMSGQAKKSSDTSAESDSRRNTLPPHPVDTSFSFGRWSGEEGRISPSDVIPTAGVSSDWQAGEPKTDPAAKSSDSKSPKSGKGIHASSKDSHAHPQSPTEKRRSTSLWEQISKGVAERRMH